MSGNRSDARLDRRVARTRKAVMDAFDSLVLERRSTAIGVRDIVERPRVGRSTLYEHYRSAEAVRLEALQRPFGPLADAAAGKGDAPAVERLLEHFWDYRQIARRMLDAKADKLLADMTASRLRSGPALAIAPELAAQLCAAAALAPIRAWLGGRAPAAPAMLASAICGCGKAQVESLSKASSLPG